MASIFDYVIPSHEELYKIYGKFNFGGIEYEYEDGFKGYICKLGRYIEGIVTDLYEHPSGVPTIRYIKGTLDETGIINFVKMCNYGNMAPLRYCGEFDTNSHNYIGTIGEPKWEEAAYGLGFSGLSIFEECIKFNMNPESTFEIILGSVRNIAEKDKVIYNETIEMLTKQVKQFKQEAKDFKLNKDFVYRDLIPMKCGRVAQYYSYEYIPGVDYTKIKPEN